MAFLLPGIIHLVGMYICEVEVLLTLRVRTWSPDQVNVRRQGIVAEDHRHWGFNVFPRPAHPLVTSDISMQKKVSLFDNFCIEYK